MAVGTAADQKVLAVHFPSIVIVYACVRMRVCTRAHMYAYVGTHMYVCARVARMCAYVRVGVRMRVCVCVRARVRAR